MHPDDCHPYLTREQLFETIRQQRIENDNKDDTIAALNERIAELQSESITLPSELPLGRLQYLNGSELDEYAERLPP